MQKFMSNTMNIADSDIAKIQQIVYDRFDKTDAAIVALRDELAEDIKQLSVKVDEVNKSHFALSDRVTRLESGMAVVDEGRKNQGERLGKLENNMAVMIATNDGRQEVKKNTSEWVKWIPGFIFGLAALLLALFGR